MSKAIIIRQIGGPEVLKLEQRQDRPLEQGEVLVQHRAMGINYIDVYHRTGLYPLSLPFTPGIEACGYVEAVGPGVTDYQPGDRVAYATGTIGGYAEKNIVNQQVLVNIPSDMDDETVAAVLVKGMTAHYLIRRAFILREGNPIVVHAAAGGVGQLLCQWAKSENALVIGIVGSPAKKAVAQAAGCDHVISLQETPNFSEAVLDLTRGQGARVVYDSVGKDTYLESLKSLGTLGLFVSYGQSSGPIPPFDLGLLKPKGLFMTRPTLDIYKANRMELLLTAGEIFEVIRQGIISVPIHRTYTLDQAAEAHRQLESRQTTGSSVFVIR